MSFKPFNWSVIIVGRWNQAILTPAGIAKYLFKLNQPQGLEVSVPIDGISPYKVKHPEIAIVAMTEINRLRIELLIMDYETLHKAMEIGSNALKELPETPVAAAGFNVKFRSSEQETGLLDIVNSESDKVLSSRNGWKILNRTMSRSFEYQEGRLNLAVAMSDSGSEVSFNFHRDSENHEELSRWLGTAIDKVQGTINDMCDILKLEIEEIGDDD